MTGSEDPVHNNAGGTSSFARRAGARPLCALRRNRTQATAGRARVVERSPRRGRSSAAIASILTIFAVLFGAVATAQAGTALSVPPDIDDSVTVGTTVDTAITIRNGNSGTELNLTDTVTQITLVPACGSDSSTRDCPIPDLGVLRPHSTGKGATGSACSDYDFTIELDPIDGITQGKYRFTTASGPIVLTPPDSGPTSRCIINFKTDVLKTPVHDSRPGDDGVQTDQKSFASATNATTQPATGTGNDRTTVQVAPLTLTTDVTPDTIPLGDTFQDQATLVGIPTLPGVPPPGGTMTFRVYKGNVCNTTTRVFGPDVVAVTGATTLSPTYRPLSTGTYRVTAQYSGDANYAAVPESACIDDEEDVLVTPKPLTLTTDVTPDEIVLGATFSDRATLAGVPTGATFPVPGGTMTFRVYKGNVCNATTLAFGPDVVTVTGVNTDSPTYRPLSGGTYRVTAQYSGDANYAAVPESACIDDEEDVLVTPKPLTLTTDVTPDEIVLGNTFTDRATLAGVPTGAAFPAPGGTMTFRVYKGNVCNATTRVFGPDVVTVSGVNTDSPTYRPLSAGTYRVTAQYSGDANYAAVPESACIDDEEDVLVTPKPLTLTTDVTPDEIVLGNTFTDRASLAGVPTGAAFPAPGGTMTFRVYKGSVCNATTLAFGPDVVTVTGVNTDSPTYRPLSAGTYRVTAQYSGDANYAAVPESACIDDEEDVLVTPKPLTLTTDVTPDEIVLGNTFTDRASLAGVPTGAAFPVPGGTMTFRVYKGDVCNATTRVFGPDVVTVSGVNTDSPTYRPLSAGTYRVTAQYSGDANYAAVPESACIDDEEDVLVTPKPLTLTTDVTPDEIVLGNTFTDRASLAGVPTGAAFPVPGGTMTFRVYKGDVCNATTRVFGPDVVTVTVSIRTPRRIGRCRLAPIA